MSSVFEVLFKLGITAAALGWVGVLVCQPWGFIASLKANSQKKRFWSQVWLKDILEHMPPRIGRIYEISLWMLVVGALSLPMIEIIRVVLMILARNG